ncbi:MAG: hypothetical protein GXP13_02960 [Gammaproteobacteria bacterium]|nr:hypothetical protein [Gammaproteobacteria bacterium]
MDDIPNITPAKPLWPKRRDEKNSKNQKDDDDENKDKKNNQQGPHDPDYDGQIDEYV